MNARELFLRKTLPVFINSFNQYSYLNDLVNNLTKNYFFNIWILDNQSTYTPLIEYYKVTVEDINSKVNVLYYGFNRGPHFFTFLNSIASYGITHISTQILI
jgi:hypothetical protein